MISETGLEMVMLHCYALRRLGYSSNFGLLASNEAWRGWEDLAGSWREYNLGGFRRGKRRVLVHVLVSTKYVDVLVREEGKEY
jgi:hypothetical protein